MKKAFAIITSIWLCILVGLLAGYFQTDALYNWYPSLIKSPLTPPGYVFPIVWNVLYICMGLSVALIYLSRSFYRGSIIFLFLIQLLCNFAWSILFFYFEDPLLGFIDIIVLDILVTLYIIRSYREKLASAVLFIPYAIWIYFATYLNGYILFNN